MSYNPTTRKHNFFTKTFISSTNFSDAKFCWNFVSLGIAISVESDIASDVIQYSFDGITVDGDMTPFQASEGIIFDSRYEDDIWFRRATPGSPVLVRLEVWAGS